MIKFLKYKKIYYTISLILIIGSLFSLGLFGLNLGIEFTGGSMMEIEFNQIRPSTQEIRNLFLDLDIGELIIQPAGEQRFIIRMGDIPKETYKEIANRLDGIGATENFFKSIGPVIGEELKSRALISIILASLAIVVYIAITFSEAGGKKIRSWQYGVIAAGLGFFHDVLIVVGFFSVIGYFYGIQVTVPIAVALLTVLGYSINDTVVIFDRVRENIIKNPRLEFPDIIDKSLNETLGRSINTSLTTLFVLLAVFFFGAETLRWFVMAMIMGISLGTYSSIFLAGPLLASWFNKKHKALKA